MLSGNAYQELVSRCQETTIEANSVVAGPPGASCGSFRCSSWNDDYPAMFEALPCTFTELFLASPLPHIWRLPLSQIPPV